MFLILLFFLLKRKNSIFVDTCLYLSEEKRTGRLEWSMRGYLGSPFLLKHVPKFHHYNRHRTWAEESEERSDIRRGSVIIYVGFL